MKIGFDKEIKSKDDALRAIRQLATLFGIHIDVQTASRKDVKDKLNEILSEDYEVFNDCTTDEIVNALKATFGNVYISDEIVNETMCKAGYWPDFSGVWKCNLDE